MSFPHPPNTIRSTPHSLNSIPLKHPNHSTSSAIMHSARLPANAPVSPKKSSPPECSPMARLSPGHGIAIGLREQGASGCKKPDVVVLKHRGRRGRIAEGDQGRMLRSWPAKSAVEGSMGMASSSEGGGYLISESGWTVRQLVAAGRLTEEMRMAAQVQAEAFHVTMPFFDDLFFKFFRAEVLAALLYRLRNSPPNRYACLVAVTSTGPSPSEPQKLVGVVDVTVSRDQVVLQHLQGVEEYLYISGVAVLSNYRRQKVATVLLKACEMLSLLWGFEYLVLRAYEDDWGGRRLYMNAGYRVVSGDPLWTTSWVGRKRRVLMIKQVVMSSRPAKYQEPVLENS